MSYTQQFLAEAAQILAQLDQAAIDDMVRGLVELRASGGAASLFSAAAGGPGMPRTR